MKTLMHICCAPCANQPIDILRTDGIEVTGFWFNPNIHPVTEYRARRNCLEEYARQIELPLLMKNDYALRPFVRAVAEDIAHRCGNATKFACSRRPGRPPKGASTASHPACSSAPTRTMS